MTDSSAEVEVKDFVECLRDENRRLVNKLCFAKKCMDLLEEYRKCLHGFANHCRCDHNFDNQMTFNRLERCYHQMKDQDMNGLIVAENCPTNVRFVRQEVSQPLEPQPSEDTSFVTDGSDSDYVLSNKFGDSLKNINDNEDYRLIYLKNKDIDGSNPVLEYFRCNWFKCNQIFDSESSLSQHIKANHFRIYEDNDHSLIFSEPQEMVIECESGIDNRSELKSKSKRVDEYVCDWVGCHRRFKSEPEMKNHKNSVHNRDSCVQKKIPRFSGLKPLTIHTLDSISNQDSSSGLISADKPFKCDLCNKTYTRKDSLKYHMNCEHNSGSVPMKMHFCDHCDYETRNVGHLNRHILRRHTNERPFKCNLEGCHPEIKCFPTMEQLKTHQSHVHPSLI